jgi:hypothetical protein
MDASWRGYRSQQLSEIDYELFRNIFNEIFGKLLIEFKPYFNFSYKINSHLHFLPSFIKKDDDWWHDDPTLLSGVIYLNKNLERNSGTMLMLDNKEVTIDNVYNRLLLYNSSIVHRPENSFGDTIDNSRLTLTFFIFSIEVSLSEEKNN